MKGLAFDPGAHVYHYDKIKVPGVTRVLERWNGLEHVDPDRLAMLADFGRHVHEAIHLYNVDELDLKSLTPAIESYLAGWCRFLHESGFVVVLSEERVYHPKMGYAGTLDSIGNFPKHKELALVDVKTGISMPKGVGPQTAAYGEAYAVGNKTRRPRRYCVLVGPGIYQLVPLTDVRDFDIFKAALTIHRWETGE